MNDLTFSEVLNPFSFYTIEGRHFIVVDLFTGLTDLRDDTFCNGLSRIKTQFNRRVGRYLVTVIGHYFSTCSDSYSFGNRFYALIADGIMTKVFTV